MSTRVERDEMAALAQRLIAVGEATTAVSHEARSSLQRAQLALEQIERHRPEDDMPGLLARLQDALDELAYLHESIRSFAAPVNLSLVSCDLCRTVAVAWSDVAGLRRGRDAALEVIGLQEAWCRSDPFATRQILRNLFQNALSACADPARVTVDFRSVRNGDGPALSVRVEDNGPGVSHSQLEGLFEPFRTSRPGGTGLGLALARRLARAHGGDLVAEGGPGGRFELTLPLVPPLRTQRATSTQTRSSEVVAALQSAAPQGGRE